MPIDHFSTLLLGIWLAIVASVLGAATLLLARSRRRARLERQLTEARLDAARQVDLQQKLSQVEAELRATQQALASQAERLTDLNARATSASQSRAQRTLELPMPREPLPTEVDMADVVDRQWETKLRAIEASLAQARRHHEVSEQSLKKANRLSLEQARKIHELTSQIDEVASSLEETRITLAEKQRELAEQLTRERLGEARVAELQARDLHVQRQIDELRGELQAHRDTIARGEQALGQAEATIRQLEASARAATEAHEQLDLQLCDKQSAYATLEKMLQEATAAEVQLRRDLKAIGLGREQLEHQNIELKVILERVCGHTVEVSDGARQHASEQDLAATAAAVITQWSAVTESDIHGAVQQLAQPPSQPVLAREPVAHAAFERSEASESPDVERELREARVRLHVLESSMGDLEYLREQNAKLREELAQDKGAARELTALQLEHKRLKLDFQVAEQKVETQYKTIENLSGLNQELLGHKAELEALGSLQAQLRDLRAENFALKNAYSGTYRVLESARPMQSDSRELAVKALDTAVVSDHLGLPVAATGSLSAESMAAVSGLAVQIAAHVRELLPVGPITTVQWVDQNGMTVTCKLFELAGDEMAMTTLGSGVPSEQALKETLRTVLQSIGWTEDGPTTDTEPNAAVG